ncbi:MAG: alkaline phosphatase family protein [Thermoanaerobaculia bacterium]|nr:alkaline phosphatase family protein [Thermoanaerobaculia bacterium]
MRAEPLGSHSAAGVFRLEGLEPDRLQTFEFEPEDEGRAGPFAFTTLASQPAPGAIALLSCHSWRVLRADPSASEQVWGDLYTQITPRRIQAVLHAGDQVYADGIWDAISTAHLARNAGAALPRRKTDEWCSANRSRWLELYRNLYRDSWAPGTALAQVLASVSNLMMWDDHDIHDGYGSRITDFDLPYTRIYEVARQTYLEYQHALNPMTDQAGKALPWKLQWPGIEFFALDLRSERRYHSNPTRILGEAQWRAFHRWAEARRPHDPTDPNSFPPVSFVVASTPPLLFGKTDQPIYVLVPDLVDDLRDQWIHGANVRELERFLSVCEILNREKRTKVIVLAGDIHVHHLVRCTRRSDGSSVFTQVTSSPIGNRPVSGLLKNVIYDHEDLKGPAHPGSPLDGRIQGDTLLARMGYAIVSWSWAADLTPDLSVSWRVLEGDEMKEYGPFEL